MYKEKNMDKKNIVVLFGGVSAEYAISLQSAHAVITHLNTAKYVPVLVGITREGRWLRYRGPAAKLLDDSWQAPEHCTPALLSPCRHTGGLVEYGMGVTVFTKIDAAFPVLHGPLGEDGTVQGLLELAGIPLVGCGTLASAAGMDKDIAHRLAASLGVDVPGAATFARTAPFAEIEEAAAALGYPVFVKPVRAGSSFGIARVMCAADLAAAVATAFHYDTRVILEEAIEGAEVGCAILGEDTLLIGEPDEVELAGGFFNYREKYNLISSQIHVPARIPAQTAAEIKRMAADIYRLLGCRGFARVDFFVCHGGRVVFSEINTIPGFTPHSRYPSMMKAAGLDFDAVVARLVDAAVAG